MDDIKTTLSQKETYPPKQDKEVADFIKSINSDFSWAKYHSMMANNSLLRDHK